MFNEIKDDDKYKWTNHVKEKMAYYRLSPSLVKRVIRFPNRTEEGVAPKTVAVMQSKQSLVKQRGKMVKKTEEIWVMYQEINQNAKIKNQNDNSKLKNLIMSNMLKMRIISAWRYPGISPKGKAIPIPDDILIALENGEIE